MIRLVHPIDTIMDTLTQRHQKILRIFLERGQLQSSDVHSALQGRGEDLSLLTIKRELTELCAMGVIEVQGSGRSTSYLLTPPGRIFCDVDAVEYCKAEPDTRYGLKGYNFELFHTFPTGLFTEQELIRLSNATAEYQNNTEHISPGAAKKELERLVIELSWKSSKIEGNTYSLLDTEKLLLEHQEAAGHNKEESRMIINHKDAFHYVREFKEQYKTVTRKNLEDLHAIIVHDLGIEHGFRTSLVGVTGSSYRPLDNVHQITEAVDDLTDAIGRTTDPYAKALLSLIGIAYIQPFADGNKRTSRLMGNALLLAHGLSPLSYRSVDESEYRAAVLAFYELNTIVPMKKIFIDQYEFAAHNYAVK